MSRMTEELRAWGCDVDGAMDRMMDDEEFYTECLEDVYQDACFDTLKEALQAGDTQTAFDAAHTLKGVLANVGLTPMFTKVVEIVEPLRAGKSENLMDKYDQLLMLRAHLNDILHG